MINNLIILKTMIIINYNNKYLKNKNKKTHINVLSCKLEQGKGW